MLEEIKIDSDIPAPESWYSVFDRMKVGDSFVAFERPKAAQVAASRRQRANPNERYVTRAVTEKNPETGLKEKGLRVWRTK